MKTKIIAINFSFVIIGLGIFVYMSRNSDAPKRVVTEQAKIVNPRYVNASQPESQSEQSSLSSESFASFIDLAPTEMLISSLVCDLNNDTYEDQIVVVRKTGLPHLFVLAGVCDTETKRYARIADIDTGISKTGTFAYSVLDLIGNHSQALVYQGYNDKDEYIMEIFLCKTTDAEVTLDNIGSFASDNTVFVQQTERTESYELGISTGASFSVWVYSSDKNGGGNAAENSDFAMNQIQTEYKWNSSTQRYEFNRKLTVSASRLAATELSRIQNGTVETFIDFMEGLWYKTSNEGDSIRYLYFDYAAKEIIFLCDDTEEIYIWEDSKLRYNGIFLTTSNSIISSLGRRFSITLSNIDEINVSVQDEISMNVSESSLWDGTYKKTTQNYSFSNETPSSILNEFTSKITSKSWISGDQTLSLGFDGCKYVVEANENIENGIFSIFRIADDFVIQFRPLSEYIVMESEYKIGFGAKVIEETVRNKTVEKNVADEDSLVFKPIRITPTEVFAADGKVIDFKSL